MIRSVHKQHPEELPFVLGIDQSPPIHLGRFGRFGNQGSRDTAPFRARVIQGSLDREFIKGKSCRFSTVPLALIVLAFVILTVLLTLNIESNPDHLHVTGAERLTRRLVDAIESRDR